MVNFPRKRILPKAQNRLMKLLTLALILFAPVIACAQVNPCDYGAIPNDGLDDSAAFLAAYKAAMETQRDVRVPAGVFELNPLVCYVYAQLNVIGEGRDKTKFLRLVNRSWTQRFRCGKGAGLRIEGIALDGNATNLDRVDGDDQHHEIRIDQLGNTKMHLVTLQSVGVHDLVAGDVGINVSARFGPMASLKESGNTWAKTSLALKQVTTGHPFELNIEPETLKRLTGKGDYYPIETSTQSRE